MHHYFEGNVMWSSTPSKTSPLPERGSHSALCFFQSLQKFMVEFGEALEKDIPLSASALQAVKIQLDQLKQQKFIMRAGEAVVEQGFVVMNAPRQLIDEQNIEKTQKKRYQTYKEKKESLASQVAALRTTIGNLQLQVRGAALKSSPCQRQLDDLLKEQAKLDAWYQTECCYHEKALAALRSSRTAETISTLPQQKAKRGDAEDALRRGMWRAYQDFLALKSTVEAVCKLSALQYTQEECPRCLQLIRTVQVRLDSLINTSN